jgi:hypothetical protein
MVDILLRSLLKMAVNVTGLVMIIVGLLHRLVLFDIYLLKCLIKTVFFRNWKKV